MSRVGNRVGEESVTLCQVRNDFPSDRYLSRDLEEVRALVSRGDSQGNYSDWLDAVD